MLFRGNDRHQRFYLATLPSFTRKKKTVKCVDKVSYLGLFYVWVYAKKCDASLPKALKWGEGEVDD